MRGCPRHGCHPVALTGGHRRHPIRGCGLDESRPGQEHATIGAMAGGADRREEPPDRGPEPLHAAGPEAHGLGRIEAREQWRVRSRILAAPRTASTRSGSVTWARLPIQGGWRRRELHPGAIRAFPSPSPRLPRGPRTIPRCRWRPGSPHTPSRTPKRRPQRFEGPNRVAPVRENPQFPAPARAGDEDLPERGQLGCAKASSSHRKRPPSKAAPPRRYVGCRAYIAAVTSSRRAGGVQDQETVESSSRAHRPRIMVVRYTARWNRMRTGRRRGKRGGGYPTRHTLHREEVADRSELASGQAIGRTWPVHRWPEFKCPQRLG